MGKIIEYYHHERFVKVDEDLKGTHREKCLCFRCKWFNPDDNRRHCIVAQELYSFCVKYGLVTPVFECPLFKER